MTWKHANEWQGPDPIAKQLDFPSSSDESSESIRDSDSDSDYSPPETTEDSMSVSSSEESGPEFPIGDYADELELDPNVHWFFEVFNNHPCVHGRTADNCAVCDFDWSVPGAPPALVVEPKHYPYLDRKS